MSEAHQQHNRVPPDEQATPVAPSSSAITAPLGPDGPPEVLVATTEDGAREIVNLWAAKGFFRLRNMGDKIFVQQLTPGAAYTIRLQTHYERRTVEQAETPYTGGPVDDRRRPPDPWQMPVRAPSEFEQRIERMTVPGTERVQMCGSCAGQGRVLCSQCNGQGQSTCPRCGGRGIIERTVMEPGGRDAQGNPTSVTRMVQQRCSCAGGLVRCTACMGNGRQTCSRCSGSGKTKSFEQLIVRFQAATQGEILDVTPVPDKWLGSLTGDPVVDLKAPRIDSAQSITPEVDSKLHELLAQSHAINTGEARILLQTLRVERVPLVEMDYKYAGVERKLWICGQQQEVYAPKAPWRRQRVLMVALGITLAIAAVACGVAFYLLGWFATG